MDSSPSNFHTPSLSWGAESDCSLLPTPPHSHHHHLHQHSDDLSSAPRRRQPTRASKSASRKSLEVAAALDRELSASPDHTKRLIPMSRPRNQSSASIDMPSGPLRLTRTGRPSKALKGQAVHACDQCGKVYTRAEHMRRHQRNHTQNLRCDLDGCNKVFHRSDMLERHRENHHNQPRGSRNGSVTSQLSDEQYSHHSPAMLPSHRASLTEHSSGYPSPMVQGMSSAEGTLEVGGMFTPLDTPVLGSSSLPSHDGSDAGSLNWTQPGFESPMPAFTDASVGYMQDPVEYPHYAYPPPPASAGAADAWYPAYCEPDQQAPTANMGVLPPAWRLAGEAPKAWNHAPQHMFLDPAFESMPQMHTPQSMHDMPMQYNGSEVSSIECFELDRKYAH